MENLYLKFLEEFEKTGLSSKHSISKFMERNFKKPVSAAKDEWNEENADASAFLADVKQTGHFTFDKRQIFDVCYSDIDIERRWYDVVDIDARLTIRGLDFWEANKANKRAEENTKKQTKLLFLTMLITVCNVLITIFGLTSTNEINKQKIQLQEQSKLIHSLQIKLSQAAFPHFQELKANKASPKKIGG